MEEDVGTDIADWFIPIEAWLKVSFDFSPKHSEVILIRTVESLTGHF